MAAAFAAAPDGAEVYKVWCASCHDHPQERIPARDVISKRTSDDVLKALTTGSMREQAKTLSDPERRALATFLTGKEPSVSAAPVAAANHCSSPPAPIVLNDKGWNGWGRDLENSRYQPHPGVKSADIPKLKVKWAFGYAGGFTYGQPTVIGDRLVYHER